MTLTNCSRREKIEGCLIVARQHMINARRAESLGQLESARHEIVFATYRLADAIRAIDAPTVVAYLDGPMG